MPLLPSPQDFSHYNCTSKFSRAAHWIIQDSKWLPEIVRSLLPSIEKRGLASASEIDIDTLAQRVRDDAISKSAICCWPGFVNAWTKLK